MKNSIIFLGILNLFIVNALAIDYYWVLNVQFPPYTELTTLSQKSNIKKISKVYNEKKQALENAIKDLEGQGETEKADILKDQLKNMNEAYTVLSDQNQRAKYNAKLKKEKAEREKRELEQKKEYEKIQKNLDKYLAELLNKLVNGDLTQLQALSDELLKLQRAFPDKLPITLSYWSSAINYLLYGMPFDDLKNILDQIDAAVKKQEPGDAKFENLQKLLFTEGMKEYGTGKLGGAYWLILDEKLRNNVFNTYISIIKNLIAQNNSKLSEVVKSADDLITLLGKNFPINSGLLGKFEQLKKFPSPPSKLDQLSYQLKELQDALDTLNKTLSSTMP